MTELLIHPRQPDPDGTFLAVTPQSAGWRYVGFEAVRLGADVPVTRRTGEREACVVVIEGTVAISSAHGDWPGLGGRPDPWSGPPDAAYLPPGTEFTVAGVGEIAICWAPAPQGGAPARVLPGTGIEVETRGHGSLERTIQPILMGNLEAESLLVVEVLTPAGHWSSYPPHKHDRDAPPAETLLEETYYHRVSPSRGFGFQRVYSDDRSLEESFTFGDRDCVLVPRGYHTVAAPPGYKLYYLNVMAGPLRAWAVANDPDHAWTLERTS
jgi:5-deoxy-glucuronate isomerase